MAANAYTGQRRRKQTPWSVRFGDAFASRMIAVGGIGTIVAILLVVLVLLATALPLLSGPDYGDWRALETPAYRHACIDESGALLWGMTDDGTIEVRETIGSTLLESFPFPDSTRADTTEGGSNDGAAQDNAPDDSTAAGGGDAAAGSLRVVSTSLSIDRKTLAVGLSDGSLRIATLEFSASLTAMDELPEAVSISEDNPLQVYEGAVYQWFDPAGFQLIRLDEFEWSAPLQINDAPLLAIDYLPDDTASRLSRTRTSRAVAVSGGELLFCRIVSKTNMLTKKTQQTLTIESAPLQQRNDSGIPLDVMLINNADHALIAWTTGTLDRFSLSDDQPKLMESQSAITGGGRLASAAPLLARQTMLCGTDDGRLLGWSVVRPSENSASNSPPSYSADETSPADGFRLELAHEIQIGDRPIVAIGSGQQSHIAVACDDAGVASLVYVTTDTLLGSESTTLEGSVRQVSMNADGNVMLATSQSQSVLADFDPGHPEASIKSYFGRVWYEGHDRPKYIWQSSAATEQAEIKLSLMPLVFGTLKATVYAMLISVPLAILAAIYTSEFLSSSMRSRVKPVVELMASLPSVVLGYVAALVVAPYLQAHLMAMLACFLLIPLAFVVAGSLWNLLPVDLLVRLQSYRLPLMFICLPIAIGTAFVSAPLIEQALFDGDLVQWLGGRSGSPVGGWMLLLTPVLILIFLLLLSGPLAEWTRSFAVRSTPRKYALMQLGRMAAVGALVLLVAWAAGALLSSIGWDLRGNLFGSYQDKNALLVGVALGFCVIPIIYTISDDALQAVPQQLRSASLGCGATPWQTTMRVVVPSAMSGLFGAIMIGLGRAVGETMVVLCAAGNTPVMEWNPFNGFKTLSAALATELPEAAKGSTHFRTLFLAALLLFVLTLVANTLAEFVRIRFRKRASQL